MGEQKVRCNMCYWIGEEEELKIFSEESCNGDEAFKGCPNCETDAYLMDIQESIKIELSKNQKEEIK